MTIDLANRVALVTGATGSLPVCGGNVMASL